jgi:GntR family transcriptional regulator
MPSVDVPDINPMIRTIDFPPPTGYNIIATLRRRAPIEKRTVGKIDQDMLDKQAPLPLYHQLKQVLSERIVAGEWRPGAQLPSERELCDRYAISLITVRQAIAELVNEGQLTRDQGRGTFVSPGRIAQQLSQLTGFTHDMRARNRRPGARVLRLQRVVAGQVVARALRLRGRASIVLIERVRTANAEPLAIEIAHLDASRCGAVVEYDLQDQSLYALLTDRFGIKPSRAEQSMTAIACPAAEAKLLGVRAHSPILHIVRTTFDQHDRPFEYVESFYRGDKYTFHAELKHLGIGGQQR